ncbi:hypothetical protein LB517_28210 [Mesorhizobium sp. BR1-1-12]|uniref:hypothetical protein n=1 Tax=unclassified Mesorhizobium TaxID=325217 RepID=UPI0011265313|nr:MULTISPECIES: hypothetical protein [unclassified Mesorhizobium]MBZ9973518.1 hypothetical protein [Mesorhizobium sp. BR1-1-12]TPL36756.1 hypothetical protein FJ947_10915 [Mesorhizobium sp. B2-4-8]
MSRVHLGLKNGRIGFWTSPSGVDASSDTGRMTLNSDYDHLKIHQSAQLSLSNNGTMIGGGYQYNAVSITYPDLGFYPLTFVGSSPSTQRGLLFPAGFSNGAGIWGGSGTDIFTYIPYVAFRNKIDIPQFVTFYPNMVLTYFVFKNKLMDL